MRSFCKCLSTLAALTFLLGPPHLRSGLAQSDPTPDVGFKRVFDSGIDFEGSIGRDAFTSTQFIDNAGVAAGDIDGDGLCDLFFCAGQGKGKLYRNLGDFKFEDATARLGLDAIPSKHINAAVFADGDGDGDLDLFLGSLYDASAYMVNDGTGFFSPSDQVSWQESSIGGVTSMALSDIDGDGDIDLYASRYLNTIVSDRMTPDEFDKIFRAELDKLKRGEAPSESFLERFTIVETTQNGKSGKTVNENGLRDVLYINDGTGRFAPSLGPSSRFLDENGHPMELPEDWGLTASFRDVDNDGDPDLYVCNDFESPDRFWRNDGNGYFRPFPELSLRRTSNSSMGVDFADLNLDGLQDFVVVDMLSRSHALRKKQMGAMIPTQDTIGKIDDRPQIMQNTLFLNRGGNAWSEIAQYAGLKASEWSWAPVFTDIDLDGYNDLIVTTGAIRDFMDADVNAEFKRQKAMQGEFTVEQSLANQKKLPPLPMRNFVFRNRGDLTFEDIGSRWGFEEVAISGGMALSDLDNDGDLDVAISNTSASPEIYRNVSRQARLRVELEGKTPNTQAIGASLILEGGGITQFHEITSGGIYASGSETVRVFALPDADATYTLSVHWPSGVQSKRILDAKTTHLELGEPSETIAESDARNSPKTQPLFEDVSHKLQHTHRESPYDDFVHQPLLPNRLSQLGPGISWADLDQDGLDDLLIPSGRGGKLAVFGNASTGFQRSDLFDAFSDQTSILASPLPNDRVSFVLGVSNHELQDSETVISGIPFQFSKTSGWQNSPHLPPARSTTGPMSQADVDGDGDLDLFVGGRAIPGEYPRPASSRLYRNENGTLTLDNAASEALVDIGLVSGSAMGDLDLDGDPDLVIACEWGPVRIFANENGRFSEVTESWGIGELSGWWNGVALGDLNNDGRLDIVATNWGRNSKYEGSYSATHPLEIYYGDLNADGTKDIVEAHFDKDMQCLVPERGFSCSSAAMPFVREKMKTFEKFGLASLNLIYGDTLERSDRVTAKTLEHTLFINRGDRFDATPLPLPAQFSPAFGVCIGDLNGDGNEDVFLAQNFFAVQVETPRNDGGFGMMLAGDGKGRLTALSHLDSGIAIYGEQRGAALADYNGDGRIDLAVAQNGAATKLFENRSALPGIRVRLRQEGANPSAIGAIIRLESNGIQSPAKLIDSGSGYWSQNASTVVMATPLASESPVSRALVTWPDGEFREYVIPERSASLTLEIRRNQGPIWR